VVLAGLCPVFHLIYLAVIDNLSFFISMTDKFILGIKLGMSQIFDEKGNVVPLTFVEAGPCEVTQIKNEEKDEYKAIQIGFKKLKKEKIKKSLKARPFKYVREFRKFSTDLKVGDKIDVSIFQPGDKVKVTSISKGKGFQGAVKRWGFSGMGSSHGVKHEHRTLGSVGCAFPQRVIKGKKMPGRMGNKKVTVKNLEIVSVDKKNNLLGIRGAIAGRKGSLLKIYT